MRRRERKTAAARLAGEKGTVFKDWGGRLKVALVYPNTYYVGMSNLGLQSIYRWLNNEPDVACERVFMPDDLHLDGQEDLLSVESGEPLGLFDVIAFTVPFELDYLHIPAILRSAGLPTRARSRDGTHPLLIAGGAAPSANPEPIAPFLDAIAVGEAEPILPALLATLRTADFSEREVLLRQLSALPGLYIPSLYEASPVESGFVVPRPLPGAPEQVIRQVARDLDSFDTATSVLARDTEFSETFLVEVARGCGHGCHFCLAGYTFRPLRERSPARILASARRGLEWTHSIGLVGSAVSDYSRLGDLLRGLREMGARVSVSSLRVETLTGYLLDSLVESGSRSITIAPEAGNQRMRKVANKRLTEEQIMAGVDLVAEHKVPELKLYFMVGLPTEERQDVEDIAGLVSRILDRLRSRFRVGRVRASVSAFVPKAHTPFEFVQMYGVRELSSRLSLLKRRLSSLGVEVSMESARWAEVQGVLARGDRRLADVIEAMPGLSLGDWSRGMAAAGLRADDYTRARERDEEPPWGVVATGVDRGTLFRLQQRAIKAGGHGATIPFSWQAQGL